MPLFELVCYECQTVHEHYLPLASSPNTPCDNCGGETARAISSFNSPFCGEITARYNDNKLEGSHRDGHIAYRIKSSPDGTPIPVLIDTWQAQREFCKMEGLINPKDVGPVMMGSDAKPVSSRGLPGAW